MGLLDGIRDLGGTRASRAARRGASVSAALLRRGIEAGAARVTRSAHRVLPGAGAGRAEAVLRGHLDAAFLDVIEDVTGVEEPVDAPPTPLTSARVVRWLHRQGFSYFLDSDGDVGGLWRSRLYYFLLLGTDGEILQVRGAWNREIAIERLEEVLEFCNDWNTDRLWPKAYLRVRDDGMVHVFAETTVDLEHGVTDRQLDLLLQCGLSTGSALFDSLDQLYPDPAGSAP